MRVSAIECVEALRLAGFRVVDSAAGATVLRRGGRVVVVPDAAPLSDAAVESVLASADMSEAGFRMLLADAPTLDEMRTLAELESRRGE